MLPLILPGSLPHILVSTACSKGLAMQQQMLCHATTSPSFSSYSPGSPHSISHPPGSISAGYTGEARLDISMLERSVQGYFVQGLAQSTTKAYRSAQNRYLRFCSSTSSPPLPLQEQTLCIFVASLGIKHATIKCYMSALCHFQISAGLQDPFASSQWQKLQYVLKGV